MILRIELGDIVKLRQLRLDQHGHVVYGSMIRDQYGKHIELPTYPDTQHDSVVWGIDRLREIIHLRVDALVEKSMLFNVSFTVQNGRLGASWRAVMAAQKSLRANSHDGWTRGWMRSMLFPEESDGCWQKHLNRGVFDLDLYDKQLNYEQKRAVNTILNELYGPVPYIISGPPGTGKTKTVVELALQLLAKNKSSHLVLCAPSNPAADTLAQRLGKHLRPGELMRMNSPSRSFPEVPDSVMPFCYVEDGMFQLPPFAELMRVRILVTTCADAETLVRARVSNADLCQVERSLHLAIHPGQTPPKAQLHWTALLMDEAAQATELEALIPLSIVAPPEDYGIEEKEFPVLVMAGDQHQLGPRTASKSPETQMSLFERLMKRPFYSDHPLARKQQRGGVIRPLTEELLPILRPAFTDLIRNYRSHPAILASPSLLFYNDTLEPEAKNTGSLTSWSGWKGTNHWPVLFACNNSHDELEPDGEGWFNVREAEMACNYAAAILKTGLLRPDEICIMSPFRAQVRVLRTMARTARYAMWDVNIGPLEAFQGLESRFVILCTTRTRDRFIEQDIARGLGVIREPKRFNVAVTRAKEGLIVIGNPSVLAQDRWWEVFMSFCKRNGMWEDNGVDWVSSEKDQDVETSRLEKQLLRLKNKRKGSVRDLANGVRQLGVADDEDTELWRSGIAVAEEVLRDEEDEETA